MKVVEIRKKAQALGLTPGKMNKTFLIRAIQNKEGNQECYGTNISQCEQMVCCWRRDCQKE